MFMHSLRRVVRTRPRPLRPPRGILASVRWGAPVVLILALALALAACGGKAKSPGVPSLNPTSSTSARNASSQDPYQQALAFARCMRQQGINMPDPKQNASGGITQQMGGNDTPVSKAKVDAAQKVCQKYAPQGKAGGHASQADLQKALAFARCMRQHGVNMPDPKIDSNGGIGVEIRADQNGKAKIQAAQSACQKLMPGPGSSQGSGGGTNQGGN